MAKLLTEIADYDEPGSWGRMSDGWPGIESDQAYNMYVFANCVDSIPYGSYVLMDHNYIRIHAEYIDQLRTDFRAAGEPIAGESIRRRGNLNCAPKWWV